jgi:hypothetical protein
MATSDIVTSPMMIRIRGGLIRRMGRAASTTVAMTVEMTAGTTDGMIGGAITSEATTSGDRSASHPHLQQVQPSDHTAVHGSALRGVRSG